VVGAEPLGTGSRKVLLPWHQPRSKGAVKADDWLPDGPQLKKDLPVLQEGER